MPDANNLGPLLDLASEIRDKSHRLAGQQWQGLLPSLTVLLRAMNSYYTNKIEGQHTLPADIELALKQEFSENRDIAKRQRIAIAHLKTEEWLEDKVIGVDWRSTFTTQLVCEIHEYFYGHMQLADRIDESGIPVQEGELRTRDVRVGIHVPPTHGNLLAFMQSKKIGSAHMRSPLNISNVSGLKITPMSLHLMI